MYEAPQARANEPIFTLFGRDPAAPHLIRAWAYRRCGQHGMAAQETAKADSLTQIMEPQDSSDPQILSAFRAAAAMEDYLNDVTIKGTGE